MNVFLQKEKEVEEVQVEKSPAASTDLLGLESSVAGVQQVWTSAPSPLGTFQSSRKSYLSTHLDRLKSHLFNLSFSDSPDSISSHSPSKLHPP